MNKVEIQAYQSPKRCKCNLCQRLEKIEKRLVIWRGKQVVGDFLLCEPCLQTMQDIISGEENILEEWEFQGGVQ